jgi:hypothetical protein
MDNPPINFDNYSIRTDHPAPYLLGGVVGLHLKLQSIEKQLLIQSKPTADKAPMGVKETAALLGRNEKTIRRWTEREYHPLPVVKILQDSQYTWCFNRDEVIEWFNLFQQN